VTQKWYHCICLISSCILICYMTMFCGTLGLLVTYFQDICHWFLQKAPVGFFWAFDMFVRMIFLNYIQKFSFITFLPAGSARRAALPVLFYSRADIRVFRPAGAKFGMPNFTLIGPGVGVYGPKTEKNWNFTNKIAPKGRVPCTIFFYKIYTFYARPQSAWFCKIWLLYFDKWQNY